MSRSPESSFSASNTSSPIRMAGGAKKKHFNKCKSRYNYKSPSNSSAGSAFVSGGSLVDWSPNVYSTPNSLPGSSLVCLVPFSTKGPRVSFSEILFVFVLNCRKKKLGWKCPIGEFGYKRGFWVPIRAEEMHWKCLRIFLSGCYSPGMHCFELMIGFPPHIR